MGASLQRLGDNPRDHDAAYISLNRDTCDVAGLRPDTTETQWDEMVANSASTQSETNPWKVYPPAPPPHWHPNPKDDKPAEIPNLGSTSRATRSSISLSVISLAQTSANTLWTTKAFSKCMLQAQVWFAMNVMHFWLRCIFPDVTLRKPRFNIPTIREYFIDLDYVLGVISDGPTKGYAYRRLKYLSGKWTMYTLLNEDEETAQIKVCSRLVDP